MRKLPVQHRPARKLLGAIVAAALFLPDTGYPLGLGEIEVNSALNQKLNADIELLSAVAEDAETIIVKLASRKEFSRAGLDRPYSLNDLRFKSVVVNGVPYIKVSSSSPIREPFLNFLVEIDWPNGHLLREYTVLLDPPVFMTQQTSAAVNVAPAASNKSDFRPASGDSDNTLAVVTPGVSISSRPTSTTQAPVAQTQSDTMSQAPATSQTSWIPAPVVQQQGSINQPAGSYKIKTGDTAWSLADAMRPDQSITVPQMMVAMLRANPESFINENINGLKRGYILRVPDYDQIATISQADALALVHEQAALWRQYQQSQAGGQPVSAMEADDTGASTDMAVDSAAGREVGSEDDAYLEIVSAGSGSSTQSGKDPTEMTTQELRAELALARERVETELVEKEALQQRVDTLQQHVEKMKGMLSIEDAELAEVQSLGLPDESASVETELVEGEMLSNDAGRMVEMVWNEIPDHFPGVSIDVFQIMPNHIHGIVVIAMEGRGTEYGRGTACRAPTALVEQFGKPVSGSLPTIVRSFKSAVTRRINEIRNAHGAKLWQRNYYEHIIRDENELNRIREYIVNNPMNWESDCENPVGTAPRVCPDNKTVRESPHQYGKETWMV